MPKTSDSGDRSGADLTVVSGAITPQTTVKPDRPAADRCPGALRLIEAADGHLARVRLPGGLVTAAQLRALARIAAERGDGRAELTSRGNVQLRALPADGAEWLTGELIAAGLLPSLDHDRVRNVLASPLAGLRGGTDLIPYITSLDAALCSRPRLAGLSGRFLFALDDGHGDVAGLGADVLATIGRGTAVVNGLRISPDEIVPVMLACAEAFLDLRAEHGGTAWRIADLPAGADEVRTMVAARLGLAPAPATVHARLGPTPTAATPGEAALVNSPARPVGVVGDDTAVLLAPLGRLTATQLTWVADQLTARPARITPWRSVVLPGQPDPAKALRDAAGQGFGTDDRSPWLRVTACAGRPGCASALADVQADAAGFAARWPGRIVHVSGCGRHCGRPAATEIDVTATSEGYEIAGV